MDAINLREPGWNLSLSGQFGALIQSVRDVRSRAGRVLRDYYGGRRMAWPVPVELLAPACGLRIVDGPDAAGLKVEAGKDDGSGFSLSGTLGLGAGMDGRERRFVIAHELGRMALCDRATGPDLSNDPYLGQFPREDLTGVMAGEFALGLLLPDALIEEERGAYLDGGGMSYPDWIRRLADAAEIPAVQAVLGYESFRRCHAVPRGI